MKTTKILSLALFSLLSFNLYAQSYMIWTALRVGNKIQSNIDVSNYIAATRLNPEAKMKIFNLAQRDYDKYLEIKNAVINEQFEPALKELAYALLLEKDATSSLGRGKDQRKGFMVTDREYHQAVQDNESKHLKTYLDQRLGIVKGRELFGEELMKDGYPHKAGDSAVEVYWNWYEYQKQMITEAFRKREIQKYEYVMATKRHPNLELRPLDVSDLKRDLDKVIDTELQGQRLTQSEIVAIISKNPALNLRVKSLHQLSLHSSALGRMESLNGAARQKVAESYELIESTFFQELTEAKVARILQYEEMAKTLSERYTSKEELDELSKQRMDTFVSGGSYNDLMMARLYTLAGKLKEGQIHRAAQRQQLEQLLTTSFVKLKEDISKRALTKENKSLLFEDLVAKNLQEQLATQRQAKNYLSDMIDMAIWVVKFDAKKASLQDEVLIQIEKKEDNFESYKSLETFLKNKLYVKGLQQYYKNDLVRNSYLLQINIDGQRRFKSEEAYDFIMQGLIN